MRANSRHISTNDASRQVANQEDRELHRRRRRLLRALGLERDLRGSATSSGSGSGDGRDCLLWLRGLDGSPLAVDMEVGVVLREGDMYPLQLTEWILLRALLARVGEGVSIRELAVELWAWRQDPMMAHRRAIATFAWQLRTRYRLPISPCAHGLYTVPLSALIIDAQAA